jgi:DnaJ-class molecular chaperone
VEKGGVRGDQIVEITVDVPAKLSPDQEELVRKFAESAGLKH